MKNLQIQALRGVFCLIIVFYHLFVRYNQIFGEHTQYTHPVFDIMAIIGVSAFFILSGFYMCSTRDCTVAETTLYYLKKILCLWIVYVFAITIIFLVTRLGFLGVDRTPTFYDYIRNLIFLQYVSGKYVDGAHWYVVVLVLAYIYYYFLDIIKKKDDYKIYLAYLILALVYSSIVRLELFDFVSLKYFNKILCFQYFPQLIIGISINQILRLRDATSPKWFLVAGLAYLNMIILNGLYAAVLPILVFLIVLAVRGKWSELEHVTPFIFIGNASYSIYLMHQYIGYTCINVLINYVSFIPAFVLSFGSVLILGVSFYYLIEIKSRNLVSNMLIFVGLEDCNHNNYRFKS